MKGIVFNLLEEVVRRGYGEQVWDDLLDAAGADGSYTALGTYSDAEIVGLVGAASQALRLPPREVLRWFGREAMGLMAERFPGLFEPHRSARPFILSVNSIIHPEVRKLYVGAACPYIDLREEPDGTLTVGYRSMRRMCGLAQGFMEGAAAHYGERIAVEHRQCMEGGDAKCTMAVSWS
ncbi:MAG TPA: heme NO-binding domain-containing protein [Hyphomicrobiales bacterium]|nr:heme NO-binding domain-containing protein [Hyphomicrobiales bacterium]